MSTPTASCRQLLACAAVIAGLLVTPSTLPAKPGDNAKSEKGQRQGAVLFGQDDTEKESFYVKKIEAYLGKDLTEDQKLELQDAAKGFRSGVVEVEKEFVANVAKITGLEEKQIARLDPPLVNMPRRGKVSPVAAFVKRLNTVLEKPLTGMQERQIARAYDDRIDDIEPLREDLTRDISKATGISVATVRKLIRPAS